MAMFKFIGDPANDGEGPDTIVVHGFIFGPDKPTEVTDGTVAARLLKNSHFERVDGRSKEAKKAKTSDDAG